MSSPRLLCAVLMYFVACTAAVPAAFGVVDGVPVPAADKRFDAVGLFIRVSPSGTCGGWISGTCTLVGPNVVLIARHCLDITTSDPLWAPSVRQYRVRFRRTVDGISENAYYVNGNPCHGTYQEIDIVSMVDAPNNGCDQVLCYLASVPAGIQPISPAISTAPLHPTDIILAGWGYAGECFASGDHWALKYARGRLPDNWTGNDYLAFSWCSLGSVEPCLSCPTIGGPFVTANLHDSGAPVLMEVPSTDPNDPTPELRLIGTVSSSNAARRPSAWNDSGGTPQLVESTRVTHIRGGDFDGDGAITLMDLMKFLGAFMSGRMEADSNSNGTLDVNDVFAFVGQWFR
jgi:hypothetical protein